MQVVARNRFLTVFLGATPRGPQVATFLMDDLDLARQTTSEWP